MNNYAMKNQNKVFNQLINDFYKLKSIRFDKSKNKQPESINCFSNVIEDFTFLKSKVIQKRIEKIKEILSSNQFKLEISTFELMEHDFRENTHSNILEYIFDHNMIGNVGADILSEFIMGIDGLENRNELSQIIKKKNYQITREKSVSVKGKSGRIDIFVIDDTNKMVIIIENKIYAGVHDIDESDTQLDLYRKYTYENYKNYKKAFILLHFRDTEKDFYPFAQVDYSFLYDIIKKNDSKDNVLKEYENLLFSITRDIDKKEINRQIRRVKNNEIINLNDLEQIIRGLYEIRQKN